MKIGVDIGYVLADREPLSGNKYDASNYPEAPLVQGAFSALKRLAKQFGAENIYIISRASRQQLAFAIGVWLERYRLLQNVRIPFENVHICSERSDKARIAQELGLNIMIDDRLEVLSNFPKEITLIAFRPRQDELDYYKCKFVFHVFTSWVDVTDFIGHLPD